MIKRYELHHYNNLNHWPVTRNSRRKSNDWAEGFMPCKDGTQNLWINLYHCLFKKWPPYLLWQCNNRSTVQFCKMNFHHQTQPWEVERNVQCSVGEWLKNHAKSCHEKMTNQLYIKVNLDLLARGPVNMFYLCMQIQEVEITIVYIVNHKSKWYVYICIYMSNSVTFTGLKRSIQFGQNGLLQKTEIRYPGNTNKHHYESTKQLVKSHQLDLCPAASLSMLQTSIGLSFDP